MLISGNAKDQTLKARNYQKFEIFFRLVERNVEKLCSTTINKQIDLLPFSMKSTTAMTACKSLGGQTLIPDSKSENENMLKDFNRKSPILQKLVDESCGPERNVWVPIIKKEDSWMHFNNRSENMASIGSRVVSNGNDLQECAYYKTATHYYGDDACTAKFCVFCEWKKKLQFTLRGLCTKSTIEDYYVLTSYLFFNGLLGYHNSK